MKTALENFKRNWWLCKGNELTITEFEQDDSDFLSGTAFLIKFGSKEYTLRKAGMKDLKDCSGLRADQEVAALIIGHFERDYSQHDKDGCFKKVASLNIKEKLRIRALCQCLRYDLPYRDFLETETEKFYYAHQLVVDESVKLDLRKNAWHGQLKHSQVVLESIAGSWNGQKVVSDDFGHLIKDYGNPLKAMIVGTLLSDGKIIMYPESECDQSELVIDYEYDAD